MGTELVWCAAAQAYGEHVIGWKGYDIPCAVLISAGKVLKDNNADGEDRLVSPDEKLTQENMMKDYSNHFPHWTLNRFNDSEGLLSLFNFKIKWDFGHEGQYCLCGNW